MISIGMAIAAWCATWALWFLFVRPLYRFAVAYRKDSKAITAAFQDVCVHSDWVEVTSVELELVAYLCLSKACGETLYADKWQPKGCLCKPAEKIYCEHCPVQKHSGWAVLLDTKLAKCQKCNPPVLKATHDPGFCACSHCYDYSHVALMAGEGVIARSTYGRSDSGISITDEDFTTFTTTWNDAKSAAVQYGMFSRHQILEEARRQNAKARSIAKQHAKSMKYLDAKYWGNE